MHHTIEVDVLLTNDHLTHKFEYSLSCLYLPYLGSIYGRQP